MGAFLQAKQNLIFYGNASAAIGSGHISRLLALASCFAAKTTYSIGFLTKECPPLLVKKIHDAGFTLQWAASSLTATDLGKLLPALLVIDDYHLTAVEWQQIELLGVPTLVIDDQVSQQRFYADIVVNPQPQASPGDYLARTTARTFCLGPKYTLLRPEFLLNTLPALKERKRLLITLGGADVKQLALPISQALTQQFTGIEPNITLVLGGINTQALPALQHLANTCPNFTVVVNSNEMAKLMASSGLAIAAAGGTLGELAAMAVPTLALVCVDNQLPALTSPLAGSWYQAIDLRQLSPENHSATHKEIFALADKAFKLWQDQQSRTAMSLLATNLVDSQGCARIVTQTLQLLKM